MAYARGDSYSKSITRRGASVVEAVDPHDGGTWELLLSHDKMDWVRNRGMGAAKELADTVRHGLKKDSASAIFRGVRDIDREHEEDNSLCYVSSPSHAWDHKTHERRKAWENEVFLIFVSEDRFIYSWYWSKCDPYKTNLPIDYETRFLEQLY